MRETGSVFGREVLDHLDAYLPDFKKIVPDDYMHMMTATARHEETGLSHEHAVEEAFKEMAAGA